jgi:integrase
MTKVDKRLAKRNELSKDTIAALTVPEGKFDSYIWDETLPSFGVRKLHTAALSFVVKFTIRGQQRKQSLGRLIINDDTTKDDVGRAIRIARDEAQTALARARLHHDFKAAEREKAAEDREKAAEMAAKAKAEAATQARRTDTIGPRIKTYIEARTDLRPESLLEVKRHLNSHMAALHGTPVADLRRKLVSDEIDRIAGANGKVTADRVKTSFSTFCAWLIEKEAIDENPCLGIKRKAKGGGRTRVLSIEELTAVWPATARDGDDYDKIVRLLLLTGQRRQEIGGLVWDEIDFRKRQIELSPERTKNERHHIIPLSDQALAILRSVSAKDDRDYVFGRGKGGFSGWAKAKARLNERLGKAVTPWRLHDLRRSFVSHCSDLDFGTPLAIEAAIDHFSNERGGIKGVYNRGNQQRQKRELMDKWGNHIEQLVTAAKLAGADKPATAA